MKSNKKIKIKKNPWYQGNMTPYVSESSLYHLLFFQKEHFFLKKSSRRKKWRISLYYIVDTHRLRK
jgi:hypothetical protein